MASTFDTSSPSKINTKTLVQNLSDKHNEYVNLNLNGNDKCASFGHAQINSSFAAKSSVKSSEYVNFREQRHSRFTMAGAKDLTPYTSFSVMKEKVKVNDKSSVGTANRSSTLSLHIAAYENCVNASANGDDIFQMMKNKSGASKKLQNINPTGGNAKMGDPHDVLEFPRQQEEPSSTDPEVMQFKASQQLLNPNESDTNKALPSGVPLALGQVLHGRNDEWKVVGYLGGFDYPVFKVRGSSSMEERAMKYFPLQHQKKYKKEKCVYKLIRDVLKSPTNFCRFIDAGKDGDAKFLILSTFSTTLLDLDGLKERKVAVFSNGAKIILAKQMFKALEDLHSLGVIHGDLKFENFALGPDRHTVLLYDFEISSMADPRGIKDAPPATEENNTCIYASIAKHEYKKLSYKDDNESLLYLIAQLFVPLPWIFDSEAYDANEPPTAEPTELVQKKAACQKNSDFMRKLPEQVAAMFGHVRGLGYGQKPLYNFLYASLDAIFNPRNVSLTLDWDPTVVYHGPDIGVIPHTFTPYYYSSTKNINMALIYNKEAWKFQRQNARDEITIFTAATKPKDHPLCTCSVTVKGIIAKENTRSFQKAEIQSTNFTCKKHKEIEQEADDECIPGDKYYLKNVN